MCMRNEYESNIIQSKKNESLKVFYKSLRLKSLKDVLKLKLDTEYNLIVSARGPNIEIQNKERTNPVKIYNLALYTNMLLTDITYGSSYEPYYDMGALHMQDRIYVFKSKEDTSIRLLRHEFDVEWFIIEK